MKGLKKMNNQLEILREMVISEVMECTDTELLDLVWKLLARSNKED